MAYAQVVYRGIVKNELVSCIIQECQPGDVHQAWIKYGIF